MSEWMPIKTAPKDGTIILYSGDNMPGERKWVTCGRWTQDGFFEINTDATYKNADPDYPTHWMPLPAPPSGESTGGKQ